MDYSKIYTPLIMTDTNSNRDSDGRVFGLEGNLYVYVVAAGMVGLGMFFILYFLGKYSLEFSFPLSLVPVLTTWAWVWGLKNGKPRGYSEDWIHEQCFGGGFSCTFDAQ